MAYSFEMKQSPFTLERDEHTDIIQFCQRHYPWFSKNEIEEAVRINGESFSGLRRYLDAKSGVWRDDDGFGD